MNHTLQIIPYTLYDIRDICIDKSASPAQRIRKYIEKVGDPYCFTVDGTTVTLRFGGRKSLTSCLADALNRTAG